MRGKRYHIWTIGCQMNVADSRRVEAELDALGLVRTEHATEADVVVLNTCVVRQSAEERAAGRLWSLKPLKDSRPEVTIALMGCMVGVRPQADLIKRYPFVTVFMPPSDPAPLVAYLRSLGHGGDSHADTDAAHLSESTAPESVAIETSASRASEVSDTSVGDGQYHVQLSGRNTGHLVTEPESRKPTALVLPRSADGSEPVVANIAVVYGCSHACTYCIIPQRRGGERSRPLPEVIEEIQGLVDRGVREVTLLGQIVDRYGRDFAGQRPDLADLLEAVNNIDGLVRIRFLTSHPSYLSDRILLAVARLPKVCEQLEVPVQAGHDGTLDRMRRGYRQDDYRRLVRHIRDLVPGAAVHTDVIVGFPGETMEQFESTYDLLAELRLGKAHLAMYSPRPGTVSARTMADDVPPKEKKRRWSALDALQTRILTEDNGRLLGQVVEVLVEGRQKAVSSESGHSGELRWRGRTRTDKLVFFADCGAWQGQLVDIRITWAGPWSLIGDPAR